LLVHGFSIKGLEDGMSRSTSLTTLKERAFLTSPYLLATAPFPTLHETMSVAEHHFMFQLCLDGSSCVGFDRGEGSCSSNQELTPTQQPQQAVA
jgi:hypothetical protein